MTSYNPINEHWSALNYELNTVILREEWGYEGMVMTDWWPKLSYEDNGTLNLRDMVIAQNDVYMLSGNALKCESNIGESLENGTLTRGQLQRNVRNILNYIMGTHTFERFIENDGKLELSLKDKFNELKTVFEYENPQRGQIIEVGYAHTGKHLLCVDYKSDMQGIAQFIITAAINNKLNINVTVNGTMGKSERIYIDFTTNSREGSIELTFPQLVNISKISVMS